MDRRQVLAGLGLVAAGWSCAPGAFAQTADLSGVEGLWDGFLTMPGWVPGETMLTMLRLARATDGRLVASSDGSHQSSRATYQVETSTGKIVLLSGSGHMEIDAGAPGSGVMPARYIRQGVADPAIIQFIRRPPGAPPPMPVITGLQVQEILVPEDRTKPASRRIAVRYLLIPSRAASPASPIIYLAGGPGSEAIRPSTLSGMLEFADRTGDVILVDQRGVGLSNNFPDAPDPSPPATNVITRASMLNRHRTAAPRLWRWLEEHGVAMSGYNTRENAADIEALRQHLGLDRVSLFGGSYGSHLALAILKYHGAHIERAAMFGLEGLDQTVKRPAAVDATLGRLAAKALDVEPNLLGTMRRVHDRLNKSPAVVDVGGKTYTFDGFAVQGMNAGNAGDPVALARMPRLYREFDAGRFDLLAQVAAAESASGNAPQRPMNLAMDVASGISDARLAKVTREAETAVFGDATNFPHPHLRDLIPLDLGDAFRASFKTDVPALMFGGDLDGRTPLEEQQEVAAQFSKGTYIEVENASHNAGFDPRSQAMIGSFLKGEAVAPTKISLPPLRFQA